MTGPAGNSGPGKAGRVLIVDDDKMFCHVLRSYLETIGLSPSVMYSAAGVIERIAEGFDIVLLDMYMARDTGMDVLISIRENYPDLPVIVMTGYSSSELKQTASSLGACRFLEKPFPMGELKNSIDSLLGTPTDAA